MILIVTAALPLVSSRHYPLFALALVVLAGEHIADVWTRWSLARVGPRRAKPLDRRHQRRRRIRFDRCLVTTIRLHSRRALLLRIPCAGGGTA